MNNIISLKISFYAVKSLILGAEKQDVLIAPVFFNCKINTFFSMPQKTGMATSPDAAIPGKEKL